mmetsp:Transcript_40745/g.126762  ORF Transcript_40745/g.126762 Transcript_40745/m.126762 type:complete len:227 (+) Transcript_40745:91-771(+)
MPANCLKCRPAAQSFMMGRAADAPTTVHLRKTGTIRNAAHCSHLLKSRLENLASSAGALATGVPVAQLYTLQTKTHTKAQQDADASRIVAVQSQSSSGFRRDLRGAAITNPRPISWPSSSALSQLCMRTWTVRCGYARCASRVVEQDVAKSRAFCSRRAKKKQELKASGPGAARTRRTVPQRRRQLRFVAPSNWGDMASRPASALVRPAARPRARGGRRPRARTVQ